MSGVGEWNSRYELHRSFLGDTIRNDLYAAAIADAVKPGSHVLDLGSGTGIWACVAARAGAARVVAVEFSDLVEHCRETVARAGLGHIVEVVRADIRDLDLPREFDVITHELVGGLVWEEDMVELVHIAASRFLKPGGRVIPHEVRVQMAPWHIADRPYRGGWPDVCGLDFGHLYAAELALWQETRHAITFAHTDPTLALADLQTVNVVRLGTDTDVPSKIEFEAVVTRRGIATGILAAMQIDLGSGRIISTSPFDPPTNWGQLYVPAAEVIELDLGEHVRVEVHPALSTEGWDVTFARIAAGDIQSSRR
jgi:SAM-dependent methyltransferase